MWKRFNWPHVLLLTLSPIFALYGLYTTPLTVQMAAATTVWVTFSGIGITGGYHRYWTHRAYKATEPLRWLLLLLGTSAVQGSLLWWARDHRVHHRYTDTDKDPYSAKKGLVHSH
ncbi:hypothetical protein GQ42DRAFT_126243, partial [Ramicandelaber brevisporus]